MLLRVPKLNTLTKENMLLEQIPTRFKKLSSHRELKYYLASPASEAGIMKAEQRLGVSFPAQVKSFYQHYNGLRVDEPQLEILPIERIDFASPKLLHFASLDGSHHLYFDVSKMNDADQWEYCYHRWISCDRYDGEFLVKSNVGVD